MTRADLGQIAAQELAHNGGIATREWTCSLLDRAVDVGHAEIHGRVTRTLGPFVADVGTQVDDWCEHLDMECHMPVYTNSQTGA